MKKLFLFFSFGILVFYTSFAEDKAKILEIEIVSKIISSITHGINQKVCLYNFNKEDEIAYKKFSSFKITNCKKANILLIKDVEEKLKFEKPALALDYLSFKNCENCIGAFYWRKGRPQIILIRERLKKFNIKVKGELRRYIIPKNFVMK